MYNNFPTSSKLRTHSGVQLEGRKEDGIFCLNMQYLHTRMSALGSVSSHPQLLDLDQRHLGTFYGRA